MGCGASKVKPLLDDYGDGLRITVKRATNVPGSGSDVYCTVGVCDAKGKAIDLNGDGKPDTKTLKTPVIANSSNPEWETTLVLPGTGPAGQWLEALEKQKAFVRFRLFDKDLISRDDFVGEAVVSLEALRRHPGQPRSLLMQTSKGDPVLATQLKPWKPCELDVLLQQDEPPPKDAAAEAGKEPKHIFMMSRGTRGDVQPFAALAIGMCNLYGWRVTVCTELVWRPFVEGLRKSIKSGSLHYLPCGGDTNFLTSGWLAEQFMNAKTEFAQTLMMAASESSFFPSCPVFVHQIQKLQAAGLGPDLIINAFTLQGAALIASEVCKVPVAGFCLQPTCIPSTDPGWVNIIPIKSHGLSMLDQLEEQVATTQQNLAWAKDLMERSTLLPGIGLKQLRESFGLKHASTWELVFGLELPMVIPMMPGTFAMPCDWPESMKCTDFIFKRDPAQSKQAAPPSLGEPLDGFIAAARAAGRKLVVMSFSSMPVPRTKMLVCATKMVSECKVPIALSYVGKKQADTLPAELAKQAAACVDDGRLLELERADFGVLFRQMDAFVVHGGLGTTVEALRLKKPTTVTGLLLMDQRFWGGVCEKLQIGTPPVHIDEFPKSCVNFVDRAFEEGSAFARNAANLDFGPETEDGVEINCSAFKQILESGIAPVRSDVKMSERASAMAKGDKGQMSRIERLSGASPASGIRLPPL